MGARIVSSLSLIVVALAVACHPVLAQNSDHGVVSPLNTNPDNFDHQRDIVNPSQENTPSGPSAPESVLPERGLDTGDDQTGERSAPNGEQPESADEGQAAVTPSATEPTVGLMPEVKAASPTLPEARSNGSLVYRYPLDLPDFRGLQPRIDLIYDSMRKRKTGGNYQGWLGLGWGLSGFEVIERSRPRYGVPAYTGADIFLLDGTELVPCAPASASPSCQTGGTHSLENENYERITYVEEGNRWEITARDGKRTTLQAVGTIAGSGTLTLGTDAHDLAYRYRWLVTQLSDTHGNEVTFQYDCGALPVCYPA